MRRLARDLTPAVFLAGVSSYFATAGLIHMPAARLMLAVAWIAGSCFIISVWPEAKKRDILAIVMLAVLLIGLDRWVSNHRPVDGDQVIKSLLAIQGTVTRLEAHSIKEADPRRQRYLPESSIGPMLNALLPLRGYRVMLFRGGSFEAEGFASQIKLVFEAAQWVVYDGKVFPPPGPDTTILIDGPGALDPGVLAIKLAFAKAGYDVEFRNSAYTGQKVVNLWF